MKKQLSIVFLCLFVLNYSNALCSKGHFEVFEKYEKATIHFLDGTSIRGYGKLVGFAVVSTEKYKIKFKASKDGKVDIWTDLMVKGITFHYDFDDVTYLYVKLSRSRYRRLLQVLEEGAVNLYIEIDTYLVSSGVNPRTGFPLGSYKEEKTYYFLVRNLDGKSLMLSPANTLSETVRAIFSNFKKKVKKFFHDCEGIKNKLDSGDFNRTTIPEIVYYYNDFCTEL
ncbi:hypothetical protein ACKGJY_14645 [Hyunsoonleella sp. 2307UL5-6]|uniref:hypothetical protein n=1 Tax=Hyunsoonleella sp. 2307UL5-6 TaxID=3384768 RepID=UPI0039BC2AA2